MRQRAVKTLNKGVCHQFPTTVAGVMMDASSTADNSCSGNDGRFVDVDSVQWRTTGGDVAQSAG
jgi:hypothetical protein